MSATQLHAPVEGDTCEIRQNDVTIRLTYTQALRLSEQLRHAALMAGYCQSKPDVQTLPKAPRQLTLAGVYEAIQSGDTPELYLAQVDDDGERCWCTVKDMYHKGRGQGYIMAMVALPSGKIAERVPHDVQWNIPF